jgi:hypothetical protein
MSLTLIQYFTVVRYALHDHIPYGCWWLLEEKHVLPNVMGLLGRWASCLLSIRSWHSIERPSKSSYNKTDLSIRLSTSTALRGILRRGLKLSPDGLSVTSSARMRNISNANQSRGRPHVRGVAFWYPCSQPRAALFKCSRIPPGAPIKLVLSFGICSNDISPSANWQKLCISHVASVLIEAFVNHLSTRYTLYFC